MYIRLHQRTFTWLPFHGGAKRYRCYCSYVLEGIDQDFMEICFHILIHIVNEVELGGGGGYHVIVCSSLRWHMKKLKGFVW